jgi:hypothetical protein
MSQELFVLPETIAWMLYGKKSTLLLVFPVASEMLARAIGFWVFVGMQL